MAMIYFEGCLTRNGEQRIHRLAASDTFTFEQIKDYYKMLYPDITEIYMWKNETIKV